MPLPTDRSSRAVRIAALLVGVALIAYALSDHPLYGGEPGFGRAQWAIAATGGAAALAALSSRWAARALMALVPSLAMLGLGEVLGEWLLGPAQRPIYQADDRLIFKFIPDRTSAMKRLPVNGGDTVVHRINRDGFRGPELQPAGAATRVVVYGDSFIHAAYSADAETFPAQLGARLSAAVGRPVEVVNAGVSSYGPDQVSLKMAQELPRLRPHLAIVAVYAGNDYGDLMRNKLFQVGPDGVLEPQHWRLDVAVERKFDLSQRESILVRAARTVAGGLHRGAPPDRPRIDLSALLAEADREYRSFVVEHDPTVSNTHIDHFSADVALKPNSESARYKVRLMAALLARIGEVARANGVTLALLFIPHPSSVAIGYDWPAIDRADYPDYAPRNLTAPLASAARALGLPYLDLFDVYRRADANALYFRGGDDHWNAAGQRLAAEHMARVVAPMLPPPR
jgi:lysophospholipase L1-like esterase